MYIHNTNFKLTKMLKINFISFIFIILTFQAKTQNYEWISGNIQTEAIKRDICPCSDIRRIHFTANDQKSSSIICLENLKGIQDGEHMVYGYFDSCNQFIATDIAGGKTNIQSYKTLQLSGKFTSKKGVKDPLSLLGYNIGELENVVQSKSAEKVIVCFDKLPNSSDLEIPENIKVEGYYETVVVSPSENEAHPVYVNPITGKTENTVNPVISEHIFYVTRFWQN